MKVYKLEMLDHTITLDSYKSILGMIECEIENMEIGDDELQIEVTCEEMTQEEYDNLPEFNGF